MPSELMTRVKQWLREPNLVTAAELVESAIVHANETSAVNAARLLARKGSATPLVRKHAALVLKRTGHDQDVPNDMIVGHEDTAHIWRLRTRLQPRDPLAWVELALAQVSCGHDEHALRSMKVALQLAPENRHVLRSAARLFVHAHDPEKAHDLIRRSPATPYDPWLMAAEIALAPGAERKPRFVKAGVKTLEEDRRLPRQVTELAGALGTMFLVEGNRKRGKRLFQQSLMDPTGNSLAQAEWASENCEEIVVPETQLKLSSDASEAMARHLYRMGDLEQSLVFVHQWIEEEPFSSLAYWAGAMTANILEDYGVSEKLTRRGLQNDPRSLPLLSNRVFSLACLGRLDEAEEVLQTMLLECGDSDVYMPIGEADRGLIAFRRGHVSEGEAHYRKAISGFRRQEKNDLERLARAYLARESARAGIPDAHQLIAEAEKCASGVMRPEVIVFSRAPEQRSVSTMSMLSGVWRRDQRIRRSRT
jgi:tetratricopeptide (TPR) repeat protein